MAERDYQKFLISEFAKTGAWAQNIHPTSGMVVGIPDLFVISRGAQFWIELKTGKIEHDCVILSHPFKPAQGQWIRRCRSFGGKAFVLAGVEAEVGWRHFLICPSIKNQQRKKFEIGCAGVGGCKEIGLLDF